MRDESRLDGKVALVTAGGSGLGEASARLLAARGARVAVADFRADEPEKTVDAIKACGGDAIALAADVLDEDAIAGLIARTVAAFGRLDLVHGNAAVTDAAAMRRDMMFTDAEAVVWDRTRANNLRGSALLPKYAVPHMLEAGGGAFVFSSSAQGIQGDIEYPADGVSQAGLDSMSRDLATQYGKQGIRSNSVSIGLVTAALDANMPAPVQQLMREHYLTPYLGRTEDVARLVAFLLSEEAHFITGATIAVDGGPGSRSPLYADMLRAAAV